MRHSSSKKRKLVSCTYCHRQFQTTETNLNSALKRHCAQTRCHELGHISNYEISKDNQSARNYWRNVISKEMRFQDDIIMNQSDYLQPDLLTVPDLSTSDELSDCSSHYDNNKSITFDELYENQLIDNQFQSKSSVAQVIISMDIKNLQNEILDVMKPYKENKFFKMNKVKTLQCDMHTVIELNNFKVKYQLNDTAGNDLLSLIRNIGKRSKIELPIPKQWRTIGSKCNQHGEIEQLVPKLMVIDFPAGILSLPSNHYRLKQIESVYIDIKALLAKMLLRIQDSDNLIQNFNGDLNDQCRLYKHFVTGDLFHIMCQKLKLFKDDHDAVPLCIGIALDAAVINTSKTRSECPVSLFLLNVINDDFEHNFIGYAPIKLPYSEDEAVKMMADIGIITKTLQKDCLKLIKRKMINEYLYQLLRPIKEYEITGFEAQVGMGPYSKVMKLYPQLCLIVSDNEQSDKLVGIEFRGKGPLNCRICAETKVRTSESKFNVEKDVKYRSWKKTDLITTKLEKILRNRIAVKTNQELYSTDQDVQDKKVIKLILKEAEYHNVKPFHNKLYNLVNNKIYGDDIHLHKILTADILHTFIKGPIEQIVSFTLVIFECLGNIDPKYKDLMAKLDLMLKVFPTKEALKPHRDCRFTEGISIFVKNKTKRSNSSGFMTSLEGWKLKPALFQMLMCICADAIANILPSSYKDIQRLGHSTFITNNILKKYLCNIKTTIKDAMILGLKFSYLLKHKTFTIEKLAYLRNVGKSLSKTVVKLYNMKNLLFNYNTGDKKSANTLNVYSAIKNHLVEHIVAQIEYYGADYRIYDTEILEGNHSKFCRQPFEKSSKNKHSHTIEMAKNIGKSTNSSNLYYDFITKNDSNDNTSSIAPMDTTLVQRFKEQQLFISNNHSLVSQIHTQNLCLHPHIKLNFLKDMLLQFVHANHDDEHNNLCTHISNFIEGNKEYESFLLSGIKINGNSELNMEPFFIRCDPMFMNNPKTSSFISRSTAEFSFVEIQCDNDDSDDLTVCQIHAIIKFSSKKDPKNYYVLIAYATMIKDPSSIGPIEIYNYQRLQQHRSQMEVQINHIEALARPAFSLPTKFENWGTCSSLDIWRTFEYFIVKYSFINPIYQDCYDLQINNIEEITTNEINFTFEEDDNDEESIEESSEDEFDEI